MTAMVFLITGSCLEKGAEYMLMGGSWGIVLLWDLSSCHCPEPLSAQPRFRTKLSGHSWYLEMISWKMGDLRGELPHRFVFSLNVGTGTFLPPCAIIGALLLPQEVSCLLLATPSRIDA